MTADAALITNGGFETGDLTGWTCFGADACVASPNPHSGSFAFGGFDNSGFGILVQGFATSPGVTYDFSFYSRALLDNPANILRYRLESGGPVMLATLTTSWALTSGSFVASGLFGSMEFLFETDSGTGIWLIDDVFITQAAVSEPATLLLLGTGLAAMGYRRRRKS